MSIFRVQLDEYNADSNKSANKPHTRIYFRGEGSQQFYTQLVNRLRAISPPLELDDAPYGSYCARMSLDRTIELLKCLGFQKDTNEVGHYYIR